MKPILIFILTCLPAISLFSQDWAPFPPGDTLIYDRASTPELDLSVWVEEVTETDDGEEWRLNPHHRLCDTCDFFNYYGVSTLLVNQPFPFGSEIFANTNGSYNLLEEGKRNYLILPKEPPASTWMLDTVNGVNARILDEYHGSIFGKADEFRLIGLSTGDSVLLSKNHGVIFFPEFLTHGERLNLVRIKNRDLGIEILDFWDIYDYQVGDVLFYSYGSGSEMGTNNFATKVEVLNKVKDADTISFEVVLKGKCSYSNPWYNVPQRTTGFTDIYQVWSMVDFHNNFNNPNPGTLVPDYNLTNLIYSFWYYSNPSIGWRQSSSLDSTIFYPVRVTDSEIFYSGNYYSGDIQYFPGFLAKYPDSVHSDLLVQVRDSFGFQLKFEPGLGQTFAYWSGFESGGYFNLVGYIRNQDTVGEIFTEEYLHVNVEDELLSAGISVFPNPSQGPVSIHVSQAALLPSELTIFTLTGKEIYSSHLTNQESIIDAAAFPKGIYLLQLEVPDGRTFRSRLVVR